MRLLPNDQLCAVKRESAVLRALLCRSQGRSHQSFSSAQSFRFRHGVSRIIVHETSHDRAGGPVDRYARWNALLELLTDSGRVSVEDAAERLNVSQATIRRDFDQLAQQQMITRTRGGAVANGVSYDLPLRYKTAKHSAEKQRIGTAAASLVEPGMVVGLNGGTTTTEVARALAVRPDLGSTPDGAQLTVVTNALNIANELLVRSRMKIVVTGGGGRPQPFDLVGPLPGGVRPLGTPPGAFVAGGAAADRSRCAALHSRWRSP